jgi:hypothetical protein
MTSPAFRHQFRLSTLFLCVTVAALLFASISAGGILGALAFCLVFGLVLVTAGLWTHHRKLAIAGGLIAAVILVSSPFLVTEMAWSGRGTYAVLVTVIDADNGKAIRNALVIVFDPGSTFRRSSGKTDHHGCTTLLTEFATGGRRGRIRKTGRIWLSQHTIEVQCDGYQPIKKPLAEFTGDSCDLYGGPIPPVIVELKRRSALGHER